jgi:uncharacterized membrane protein YedE/YeeE|tara:strand:+ start:237 stop:662 length:426 start_codon:yes stop_codon:yes gene_type:complete
MYNFTPLSSLTGGIIIGFAVVLFFYTTGRLAGISGIFANALTRKLNRSSNLLFLLGLVIGPIGYLYLTKATINFEITNSYILIIIAGFLVGLGTRMGGGCTSGHGICGISRISVRSIIATITFMFTGMLTVFILQQFGMYL